MLADSGSESGCGRLKVQPQSEQCPVCWPLSLALSSMVLSTTTMGEEGVSLFDTSESDKKHNVYFTAVPLQINEHHTKQEHVISFITLNIKPKSVNYY